jgi:hypothetical protein
LIFWIAVTVQFADVQSALGQHLHGGRQRVARRHCNRLNALSATRVRLACAGDRRRSRRRIRLMYDVKLVRPSLIPASSSSHLQMLFMLCPPWSAASISGHNART